MLTKIEHDTDPSVSIYDKEQLTRDAEPPLGSVVLDYDGDRWLHTEAGWICPGKSTWADLWDAYGPLMPARVLAIITTREDGTTKVTT